MDLHIANENWLWPLALVFLGWTVLVFFTFWRDKRDLEWLGAHRFLMASQWVWARRLLKGCLLLSGFFLLFLGAARLQGKPVPEDLNLRGSDVMVVLDLSKSMLTQDIIPNRLDAAKKAVLTWLGSGEGNRVGVVVFAGEAMVQVPLTFDLQAVSLVLEKDDVDVIQKGGTDIGQGIQTALASFSKDEQTKRGKAILLLTDGETTDGASNVTQACLAAQEQKIHILAVGLGTRQGRPIPGGVSFWGEPVYKKDPSGGVHVSHLDEGTLQKMADMTGGAFIHGDTNEELASIQSALSKLEQSEMKGKGGTRRKELAPSLSLGAAAVLLLSSLM